MDAISGGGEHARRRVAQDRAASAALPCLLVDRHLVSTPVIRDSSRWLPSDCESGSNVTLTSESHRGESSSIVTTLPPASPAVHVYAVLSSVRRRRCSAEPTSWNSITSAFTLRTLPIKVHDPNASERSGNVSKPSGHVAGLCPAARTRP